MKKSILIFTVLFFGFISNSYSQGLSRFLFGNVPAGTLVINFFDPCSGSNVNAYVGVLQGTLDGVPNVQVYCVDLCTEVNVGDTLKDSAALAPKIIYVLNNYYPKVASYPGKLADNFQEAAAIQFALWNLADGFDLNSYVADLTLRNRALAIAADANTNGGSTSIVSTFNILFGGADEILIQTLDGNGNPIAHGPISLSISEGSLSTYTTSTGANGLSAPIQVTASNAATITASGDVTIPSGYSYVGLTIRRQKLGITNSGTIAHLTTSANWGALPVELSSFTAVIDRRNVELSWKTVSETNNSGFEVERKLTGSDSWQTVGFVNGNGTTNVPRIYLFTDNNVATGKYNYRLKQIDYNGNFEYHNLNNEVEIGVPNSFSLSQNYPNPFNPSTKINFEMAKEGNVSVKVFDYTGKEVATLVNGYRNAGFYTVNFNAANLSSGIYFYRMETSNFTKVMKMSLVK
jgi:hypothetical protein